jgi:hypothetical protein
MDEKYNELVDEFLKQTHEIVLEIARIIDENGEDYQCLLRGDIQICSRLCDKINMFSVTALLQSNVSLFDFASKIKDLSSHGLINIMDIFVNKTIKSTKSSINELEKLKNANKR